MRQKIILVLLVLGYAPYLLFAQQKAVQITLEESLQVGLKNNPLLKIAQIDKSIRKAGLTQTKAFFLPGVDVSYSAIYTNNPLNTFGFKLQQEGITQNDFNPHLLNNPEATENYSFKISVSQPLINADLWLKAKAAKLAVEAENLSYDRKVEFVTYQVKSLYYQVYLAYKSLAVAKAYKETLEQVLLNTEARFKNGYLQQADVLKIKAEVLQAETEVFSAEKNYQGICDQLSLATGNTLGNIYEPAEIKSAENLIADTTETEFDTRKDFLAIQKGIEAQTQVLKSEKNTLLPNLNVFADWLTNDAQPTGFGANAYLAGFQLSWKPFTGFYRTGKIEIEKENLIKQQEQFQQYKDNSQLERRQTQLLLIQLMQSEMATQKSVEVAQELFRITSDRFSQGLTSSTELLLASTNNKQQQLTLIYITTSKLSTIAYQEFLK